MGSESPDGAGGLGLRLKDMLGRMVSFSIQSDSDQASHRCCSEGSRGSSFSSVASLSMVSSASADEDEESALRLEEGSAVSWWWRRACGRGAVGDGLLLLVVAMGRE